MVTHMYEKTDNLKTDREIYRQPYILEMCKRDAEWGIQSKKGPLFNQVFEIYT